MSILLRLGMSGFLMYVVFTSEFTIMSIFGFVIAALIFLSIFDNKQNIVTTGKVNTNPDKHYINRTAGLEYVPGYGYRDKEGNYYDHIGNPVPTPVVVNTKKK